MPFLSCFGEATFFFRLSLLIFVVTIIMVVSVIFMVNNERMMGILWLMEVRVKELLLLQDGGGIHYHASSRLSQFKILIPLLVVLK